MVFTIPQSALLDKEAGQLGLTVSELIRRIIDRHQEQQRSDIRDAVLHFPNDVALGDHEGRERRIAEMRAGNEGFCNSIEWGEIIGTTQQFSDKIHKRIEETTARIVSDLTSDELSHLTRKRPSMTKEELSENVTQLLVILFPRANEPALSEMKIVGDSISDWIDLFVDSKFLK